MADSLDINYCSCVKKIHNEWSSWRYVNTFVKSPFLFLSIIRREKLVTTIRVRKCNLCGATCVAEDVVALVPKNQATNLAKKMNEEMLKIYGPT